MILMITTHVAIGMVEIDHDQFMSRPAMACEQLSVDLQHHVDLSCLAWLQIFTCHWVRQNRYRYRSKLNNDIVIRYMYGTCMAS